MIQSAKQSQGTTAYFAGFAAEDIVARTYMDKGHSTLAKRWRGVAGEIDLIAQDGDGVIIIEVKKSRTHSRAATRVTTKQLTRIYGATAEFLETQPKGQLTPVRVDVALVDDIGRVDVIENVSIAA